MISLDYPIWKELGSAGSDTDEILRDLMEGKGDFRENMEELSWDLSHQASWYDMTAYALPHLAALCAGLSPEDKAFLIKDIGMAIAAEGAWPLEPDTEAFREFQEGLRGLRRETEKLVTNPDIAAILGNDPTGERSLPFLRLQSLETGCMHMGCGTCLAVIGMNVSEPACAAGKRELSLFAQTRIISAWNRFRLLRGTASP